MIKLKKLLVEIDWEKFADVSKTNLTPEDVAARLNAELDRLKQPSTKRDKADISFARLSKGNIPVDSEGRANIKQFITDLMQKPKTIFDEGMKSLHTAEANIATINTGIPALKAVLWDEDGKKFYVITTCKGAGQCINNCYAMQGFYIMNDGKNIKLIRRLQMLMNHPEEYEARAFDEADNYAYKATKEGKTLQVRWNDAGDIFSDVYFDIIVNVTKKLKAKGYNVESYAYTKTGKYVKLGQDQGLTMTFSSGASQKEKEKVDLGKAKIAEIFPYREFQDLFKKGSNKNGRATAHFEKDSEDKPIFKDESGKLELKKRIYDFYHGKPEFADLTIDSLKFTNELPHSIGKPFEYNAIVLQSGDSDRPAQRTDVKAIFLLEH